MSNDDQRAGQVAPCLCTYADDVCPFRGPGGGPQCTEATVSGNDLSATAATPESAPVGPDA